MPRTCPECCPEVKASAHTLTLEAPAAAETQSPRSVASELLLSEHRSTHAQTTVPEEPEASCQTCGQLLVPHADASKQEQA